MAVFSKAERTDNPPPLGLLSRLPGELRNEIYYSAYSNDRSNPVVVSTRIRSIYDKDGALSLHDVVDKFFVCKAFFTEALSIFLETNTFEFRTMKHASLFALRAEEYVRKHIIALACKAGFPFCDDSDFNTNELSTIIIGLPTLRYFEMFAGVISRIVQLPDRVLFYYLLTVDDFRAIISTADLRAVRGKVCFNLHGLLLGKSKGEHDDHLETYRRNILLLERYMNGWDGEEEIEQFSN